MSVQAELPVGHPMRAAWEAYKATDDYANTRSWALKEAHVDGSLWAAFVAGYTATPAPAESLDVLCIPRSDSLDPITVYLDNIGDGHGRATIVCYNEAWTCYWGAMGDRTLREFIACCDASYVSGNMLSGRGGRVLEHTVSYAVRVAQAVIDAIKATPITTLRAVSGGREEDKWERQMEEVRASPEYRKESARLDADARDLDEAVNRFLGWRLPDDFAPDAGISFTPSPHPHGWPVGTNLLTAIQARAMFAHCLPPHAAAPALPDGWVMVRKEAIDWLNGESNFECPPDRYFRGEPPRYWWRSVFREKAGLAAAPLQREESK